MTSHKSIRFIADTWKDYELVDSGDGAKLERFGTYVLDRPEPGAVWPKALDYKKWDKADASFEPTGKRKASGKISVLYHRNGILNILHQSTLI